MILSASKDLLFEGYDLTFLSSEVKSFAHRDIVSYHWEHRKGSTIIICCYVCGKSELFDYICVL